jgi:endonuclease/exonuclease/phosphatase family metal-dependent hydrolase
VRLVTFNVLHGRSPSDDRVDLDRFAAAVADLDADVLALQEVDLHQPRSHGADLTDLAARAMGAQAQHFGPALSGEPGSWRAATDDDPAGTPQYGVALLSRRPVLDWRLVRLPRLPRRAPVLFRGRRRPVLVTDEPRVAVVARIETPSGPVAVVSTHLSFVPGWNLVQLRHLVHALCAERRVLLLGDLNLRAAAAVRTSGMRPLVTAATFPAEAPVRQIDHVLARGPLSATSPGSARQLPLSDHRALVVDVEADRRLPVRPPR